MLPPLGLLPPRRWALLCAGTLALAAASGSRGHVEPHLVMWPVAVATPAPAAAPAPVPPPEPFHGVRAAGDTVIAWTPSQLLLRRYEGGPFEPRLDAPGRILGADVADDGTVYLVREDRLGVLVRGHQQTWRRLPFGSWPDEPLFIADVFTDGDWLGIVADASVALTNDQGRTWKVLAIPGESDYPQHAAVMGERVVTTGERYGFEGSDSTIQIRTFSGRSLRSSLHEYATVAGIGDDGTVYTACAGLVCGDAEYAGPGWYSAAVRAPGVTIGLRDGELFRIGKGRETSLTTAPDGFVLGGTDEHGRVVGVDPRGVVRWSAEDGWVVLLPYSSAT